MDERLLRYFVTVVEESNITRAAERLGVSQPALSQQLKRLERDLSAVLLERSKQGVTLTSAGQAFLPYAQRVLGEFREARTVLSEVEGLARGHLSIGTVQSVNINLMPLALAEFGRRYPGVSVNIRELASDQVEPQLARGKFDVGISFLWEHQPDFVTEPLFREELMLVVPDGHPFWSRREVEVSELDGVAMVNIVPGSKRIWDACCEVAGIRTNTVAEMSSIASVIVSVRYMAAVAVVPAMALVGSAAGSTVGRGATSYVKGIPLRNPKPERTVGCLWRRQQYRSQLSRVLATMLREAVVAMDSPWIRPL